MNERLVPPDFVDKKWMKLPGSTVLEPLYVFLDTTQTGSIAGDAAESAGDGTRNVFFQSEPAPEL